VTPPTLARVLGLWGAVWLGLGSILGTGVFVSLGMAAGLVGPGIVPATLLAALVAVANGLSSAQLAAAYPVSGGTYEYAHRLVHPIAGFAAGWLFLTAKSASAATAALGCAGYLLHALGLDARPGNRIGLALALVLGLTALVAGGLKRSSRANMIIVSLTLTALVAFVGVGLLSIDPALVSERLGPAAWRDAFARPRDLLHATALVFVAYTGYGRIATLGEEVHEPARTIPRAIVVTLALSMLLYASVAATAVAVVGSGAWAASTESGAAPLEMVSRAFVVPEVAVLVRVGAVTAMAGVLLNLLLGLSRVLLAMARRGDLPAAMGVIRDATGSPVGAVWTLGVVIALLVLTGDVRATWSLSAFTVLVYYGLTHLAALRMPQGSRRYPRWVAQVGLASCLSLAFLVAWPVWLTGLGLLVAGFAVRALVR
jgi:APA family basic amino acid/polyamine antiporter